MKVLGLAGSPRRGGNTEPLLDRALAGAASQGAEVEKVVLSRLKVAPCVACDGCFEGNGCVVRDDFQLIYPKLIEARGIILASPIYFMGVSAQAKALIDRCQCLWARKYVAKVPLPPPIGGGQRQGLFLATAGSRVKDVFRGAVMSVRYLWDALDAAYFGDLLLDDMDEKGAIMHHPAVLEQPFSLGSMLALLCGGLLSKMPQ